MNYSFVREKKASASSRANTVTESVRSKPQLALNILNYMLVSGTTGEWAYGDVGFSFSYSSTHCVGRR